MPSKCVGHKKDGTPCGNYPRRGGTVCNYHGGKAPQVENAARKRLLEAADPAAEELARIAVQGEDEAVRVRAINSLLDRADVVGTKQVAVDVTGGWQPPTVDEAKRALAALKEGT